MTKDVTLNEVGEMLEHVVKHMATKEDVAELRDQLRSELKAEVTGIKNSMATKDHLFQIQIQVNSIETQLRAINHGRLEVRVADLEEEVFGKVRD